MSNFNDELNLLEATGVDEDQLKKYKDDQIDLLKSTGVSDNEINDFLGTVDPAENENVANPITNFWQEVKQESADYIGKKLEDAKQWAVGDEAQFWDSFWKRGVGASLPNIALSYHTKGEDGIDINQAFSEEPEDTGHVERWLSSMGTIIADLPGYLVGGAIGNRLTGGNQYATGFGAGFVNESIKGMYLEALQKGDVENFSDWWKIYIDHGVKEGVKSGITLGTAMGLPKTLGFNKNIIGKYLTQYAAFVGVGSALEQKMPTKDELINTGLVLATFGGLEAGVKGTKMVFNRVKKTNKSPSDVVEEVLRDPKKFEDVTSRNIKEFRDEVVATDKIEPFVEGSKAKPKSKKTAIEEAAKQKPEKSVQEILEKVPEKELLERFDKLTDIVTKAEKPQETITPELQKMLEDPKVTPEQFSRARGYTEKEIAEYKEFMDVANEVIKRKGIDFAQVRDFEIQMKDRIVPENIGNKSLTRPEEVVDYNQRGNVEPEILNIKTSDAVNKIIENVGASSPKPRVNMEQFKSRFITETLDKLHPIFVAVREFEKAGGKFPEGYLDPYKTARIQPGMEGRAMHFIRFGTLNFKTLKNNGKSLIQVLEPIKNAKDMKEAISYFVSKRALEKAEQGKETGFPLEEARAVVRELGPKWEPVLKEVVQYQTRIMDYLVDSGIIARENANLMLEANRDYVPFYKVLDSTILGAKSSFGNAVKNPYKQFAGGKYKIEDPIQSIYKNTMHHVVMAERNNSFVKFIEMVETLPETFPNIKKKGRIKPTKVEAKEMQEAFDAPIKPEFAEGITVFRREHGIVSPTEIAIYRNGKREVWEVGKELASAFKNTNAYEANMLIKFLSVPSRLLRAGATLAPDFMLRNFNRDTVTSAITSSRDFIPFVHSTMGFWHMIKQDKVYQEWVKSGGLQSTVISMDRNYFQKDIAKFLYGGKVRNQISNPLEMLRIMSELFESTSRIGNMKLTHQQLRSQKGNISDRDIAETAGFEGRDLSIDFAKIGTKVQALNMITSFFNARLQGYARLVKAFKENPTQTSWRVFKYITAPSLLLWWVNHDDERYKQLPQWQKDLFWIVITPEIGVGDAIMKDDNDYTIYRIPKPFEPGLLFGTLPERALDWAFENKGPEFAEFVKQFVTSNLSGLAPIPDFAKPFVESWSNKSLFTDLPIIPYGTEKFAEAGMPQYQYNEYTSETAKLLGKQLSEITGGRVGSPARIDSIVQNWTGTLGRYAIQTSDFALKQLGVIETPDKPAMMLEDIPVIKSFLVRNPSGSSEYIQKFYKKQQQGLALKGIISNLEKEGNFNELAKVMDNSDPGLLLFEQPAEAMSNIRAVIRKTYANTEISDVEKRQLIDELYQTMIDISKETLKAYEEIK